MTEGRAARGIVRRASRVRLVRAVVPLVLLVILWQIVTSLWLTEARIFPPPGDVLSSLGDLVRGEGAVQSSYAAALATLMRIMVAFLLSLAIGVAVGVAAGRHQVVFDLTSNLVWVAMAVPSVVWAFIFVVVVGTGNIVPIAALMALLVPNVLITIAEGTKALSRELGDMADSYSVTRWEKIREVYFPQLVPYVFSAARVSFGLAVKISVVAEVVGVEKGIGYELDYWYTQTTLAPVIAWGLILTVLGLLVNYLIFEPMERRLGRWKVNEGQAGATAQEMI